MEEDYESYANSDSTTLVSSSPDHSNHPSNQHSMMSNGHTEDHTDLAIEPANRELHINMSADHKARNDVALTPTDPHTNMFDKKSPIMFAIHDETNLNQCKISDKNKFNRSGSDDEEGDRHRHIQSYDSTHNLTGVGKRYENVSGIDNPAFGDSKPNGKEYENGEGRGMNGGANTTITMGLTSPTKATDQKMPEAVNLELVNMTPLASSGKINGQVGADNNGGLAPGSKALNSIPIKKDTGMDMNEPHNEYFVPVNEHRKFMRYVQCDPSIDICNMRPKR